MIADHGWRENCIWEHSSTVKELYSKRCRQQTEEMTCAAQAAELLAPHVLPGDTLLDVGCGSGYFFHSLRRRQIPVEYYGIDAAPSLISIGRQFLPQYGLPRDNLRVMRIEDLSGSVDHVVCMNVLSNIDNFHRPLERILNTASKTVVLRESCSSVAKYQYVVDKYLDEDVQLRVHVNTYDENEIVSFMASFGMEVQSITDRRTGGKPELVIDYPHYWKFFFAKRIE